MRERQERDDSQETEMRDREESKVQIHESGQGHECDERDERFVRDERDERLSQDRRESETRQRQTREVLNLFKTSTLGTCHRIGHLPKLIPSHFIRPGVGGSENLSCLM